MTTPIGPPFDPEVLPLLERWPKQDFDQRWVLGARHMMAQMLTPEFNLTDPGIVHDEISIPGPGGELILLVIRSENSAGSSRPCIYWMHGGAMAIGNRYFNIKFYLAWIKELDLVLISPEYRLTPENPDPAPIEDCYAGLEWIGRHAEEICIDPSKVIVGGPSAGGGLAAGITLMARHKKGPKILAQLLTYPMIDDEVDSVSNKQFWEGGPWSGKMNLAAWDFYLPGRRGTEEASIYAAPLRAKDFSGLPQAYVDVGSADPLRDESVRYASKLWEFGVQAELHVIPGGVHGFDTIKANAGIAKFASELRITWLRRILNHPTA